MGINQEIVRATFPDGSSQEWTAGPGISLRAAVIKEFVRVCVKPTPLSVEIIQTASPELPLLPPND